MGTSHLLAVKKDGQYKIAQYGQWDGYPSGNGLICLKFLIDNQKDNFKHFKNQLDLLRFQNDNDKKEEEKYCKEIGAKGRWMTFEQSKLYKSRFPFLSRDIGCSILTMINNAKDEKALFNSINFAYDSLFCEYAYIIDFDSIMIMIE